jgi:hypothetical protein
MLLGVAFLLKEEACADYHIKVIGQDGNNEE